jgi:tetratricopeptide (TPR) repeat protein
MEDLIWAFVRPKRPQDRQMAYAQSMWICQYIEQRWGHETTLKMMDLYKQGRSETEVFQTALGMNTTQFSKDFFAWTEKQVAGWGFDPETTKKCDAMVKNAEALQAAGKLAEAAAAWEEIVKLRPMSEYPRQRLAGLYLAKEIYNPQKSLEQLLFMEPLELNDVRFTKRIARLYVELNDIKKAEQFAAKAIYVNPYDDDAHELLLSIYEKTGNQPGIEREKRTIPELKDWLKQRKAGQQ